MEIQEMLQKKEILIVEAENSLHILASFFAFIFAIGLYFISFFKFPVDTTILDTHVRAINMESTRVQSILFMILMGFLVIICTCMLLCTKVKIFFNTDKVSVASAILLVIASIVFGSWSKQFLQGFLFVAVFLIFLRTRWFALISNVYSQSIFSCSLPYEKVFSWILACIVVVYITIFLVAPLATPLLISGATELRGIEGHYAVTVLPGFDLIGGVERANYGLGMPLLTALALKVFALFKISNVSLVQAVKLNQLIAVVLICFLSFLTNRKYFPYVMAMALGMTAFTLSNVGIAVGYPNQSGIRYIPILTSLIVLVMELHRAQLRVWVLASTAAIFVILSPETGLATTAGYITATILKKYIPITPISSIARTLLWFGVVFLVTLMLGSVFIIGPILKNSSNGIFQFLALFTTGGYGGMVDKPSMVATLLFFIATTKILQGVWRARNDVLTSIDTYEVAVGTIMLVWLMYYVNRMAEWNLWFQLVLLTLLVAPRISLSGWHQRLQESLKSRAIFSMIIICLVGGQLTLSLLQFKDLAVGWRRQLHAGCGDAIVIDGKCLPWLHGSKFELQMNALTKEYSPAETLVLTGVSTYVRLHGFNEGFPWYDPMEIVHKNEVKWMVDWIDNHGPKYVLADDPTYDIALAAPEHSNQIQSYLPLLISYKEMSRKGGWIVMKRVANDYGRLREKHD